MAPSVNQKWFKVTWSNSKTSYRQLQRLGDTIAGPIAIRATCSSFSIVPSKLVKLCFLYVLIFWGLLVPENHICSVYNYTVLYSITWGILQFLDNA